MLNIFCNKNNLDNKPLNTKYTIEKTIKVQNDYENEEFKNIIFYSSSTKE